MNVADRLSRELLQQDFAADRPDTAELERYREAARNYARLENALVVLSDLRTDASLIFHGGCSLTLGTGDPGREERIGSIWERSILGRIHPDDLHGKYVRELRFLHFCRHRPPSKRFDYLLAGKLRMRDAAGGYLSVLHRMRYLPGSAGDSIRLALCLYQPLPFDLQGDATIVDTVTGQTVAFERHDHTQLLTERERQVLRLIDRGLASKQIARELCISIHTVSRHRHEILSKLRVRNSVEACRIGRELGIV